MSARAARFGAAMAALWAAHDLADHVVQTDHQAFTKSGDWRGMAGHICTYHVTQAAALAALSTLGVRPSWRRTTAGIIFSAASHAFLDRRWPVVRLLEHTGSKRFAQAVMPPHHHGAYRHADGSFGFHSGGGAHPLPLHGPYLADQALHHVCLAVAAYVLASGDG